MPLLLVVGLAGVLVVVAAVAVFAIPIEKIAYAAVAMLVLVITWNGFRLVGGALANAFLLLSFAAVIGQAMVARRAIRLPQWLFAAAIGFAAAAMLNVIFPANGGLLNETLLQYRVTPRPAHPIGFLTYPSNLLTLVEFEISLVVIPLLIAAVATTAERVNRLIDMWTISAAVNGAVGLVQYATQGGRAPGLTIHPNYLALTCAIAIPTALLWVSRGGRWRTSGLFALTLMLGGEYASGSRSGAIAALLAIAATVAAIPRLRRGLGITAPLAGMAVVAVLAFTSTGQQAVNQLRLGGNESTVVNTTGSDMTRTQLANVGWDQFQARPLQGVGFAVIEDAHDIYLQLLAAGGLLALASFVVFVGGVASSTLRARTGPLRDAASAVGIAFVVWLVNGVFTNQLADKYLYVVPGLLLAMSYVAVTAGARATDPVTARGVEPPRSVAGATAGATAS
jgi:hypothetical protein